jgi:hypothetical protein
MEENRRTRRKTLEARERTNNKHKSQISELKAFANNRKRKNGEMEKWKKITHVVICLIIIYPIFPLMQ